MNNSKYNFFEVEFNQESKIATLWMNSPDKKNRLDGRFWNEFPEIIHQVESDDEIKVVIIAGRGSDFCTGLDLKAFFIELSPLFAEKSAENRESLYHKILWMQSGFSQIANGKKIYLSAIQGWCIGAGLDLAASCDLRLASADAKISLRETKMGIVADLGSLQRLPSIIGQGKTRLMAFTGRDVTAVEAEKLGLVEAVYGTSDELYQGATLLAKEIAGNPAIVLRGVKQHLNYIKSHTEEDGLRQVAVWNSSFLDSSDFHEAIAAFLEKRQPKFN